MAVEKTFMTVEIISVALGTFAIYRGRSVFTDTKILAHPV
jgi:hypothetical protein